MSNDYDPRLLALFAQARQEFDLDAFTRVVLERIDRERRRTLVAWLALGLAGVIVLALLAQPLITTLVMVTQFLPVSLVDIETDWLRLLLSPINSIAAAIAVGALGIRSFVRRFLG